MGQDDATRRVSAQQASIEFDATSVKGPPASTSSAPPIQRGASVGRYVIIDALGHGGMGQVYAAYDPELARRVAIKTLRRSVLADLDGGALLLAEAQSLARLSHPNIVAVYDAGAYEDSIFIAMEHIEGLTVSEWLHQKPEPSWRQILDAFLRAGRGLAAAHHAGIVHRDFKPSNVMVDTDESGRLERVRVVDFGLARRAGDPSAYDSVESHDSEEQESGDQIVLGTPVFMAPEHLRGQQLDARSDQFSFCVSLWMALYGLRPFSGRQTTELLRTIEAQDFQDAIRVGPGRLRRHLRRGLQFDADDRYPSMEALLDQLSADYRLPVRRAAVAIAGASAVGLLGVGYFGAKNEPLDPCPDAGEALVDVWDGARRAAVEKTFSATNKPFAADAWSTVSRDLDAYARRWIEMRNEACKATRVRGEQSEELFDRRMRCLSERRSQLNATATLLAEADDDVIRAAVHTVGGLGALSRCSDTALLSARVAPPSEEQVEQAADLEDRLAKVRALARAAALDEAADGVDRAVEDARRLGYTPALADALLMRGQVLFRRKQLDLARDAFFEAMWIAVPAEHDYLVCDAWVGLVRVAAMAADFDAAEQYGRHARSFIERLPDTAQAEARLSANLAYAAHGRGDLQSALELYRDALTRSEDAYGERHLQVAAAVNNIGTVHGARGEHEEALRYFRRANKLLVEAQGPSHPEVGTNLNNIAISLEKLGDIEGAQKLQLESLELREAGLGPDHPDVAIAYQNLGAFAERHAKDYEQAATYFEKALRIKESALGAEHPSTAMTRSNLALTYGHLGQFDKAGPLASDALEHLRAKLGETHPVLYYPLFALGRVEAHAKHRDAAVRYLERALELRAGENDLEERMEVQAELERVKSELREHAPDTVK